MSTNDSSNPTPPKGSEFFERNGWWWASAALILFAVVGVIAILAFPKENPDATAADPADPSTEATSLSSPAESGSGSTGTGWDDLGCNGTEGDTKAPTTAPNADWEPVGPMSAPKSDDFGPKNVEGAIRSCYQHSPTGAVMAAANLGVAISASSTSDYADVIENAYSSGTYKDAALTSKSDTTQTWKVAGYKIDSCSETRCNVLLAIDLTENLAVIPCPMVWSDGDWRLDGTQPSEGSAVESLPPNYTPWGP